MGGRKLKKEVLRLLRHKDFKKSIVEISGFSARQVVNPLFSFFYNSDELVKWHAVTDRQRCGGSLLQHHCGESWFGIRSGRENIS